MEGNSKIMLEAQIRECFGRVVWTHKTQEKCADILLTKNKYYKTVQIILSALTTTGLIVVIFGDCKIVEIFSAIISSVLLIINTYLKSHDLGGLSQKHSDAASDLWNIRESYFSLLTDLKTGVDSLDEIKQRRDDLQLKLSSIYKSCPRTNPKAYKKASKALNLNEEMTFSDDEINNFLPVELRK